MPEGHTLHRLALDLDAAFAGRQVAVSSPQGRFAEAAALLDGSTFDAAMAHGKHLFCEFAGERFVHVHLGLIGKFDLATAAAPVGQVRLRIATAETAADLRGPQLCALRTPDEVAAQLARLGPDPLRPDSDPEQAWRRIHRSSKPIAALLMDQSVLSGVGNVYRAEVLFRLGIAPMTAGTRLSHRRWQGIWDDLTELMPYGVEHNRIDTVRPEHTPEAMGREPREDDHGGEVYVYRRNAMPCLICGTEISTKVLEGRNLFWCRRCQR